MARSINIYCVLVLMLNFSSGLFTKRSYNQYTFSETTSKFPFDENPKPLQKNGSNYIKLKLQIDNYSMLKCKCIESTNTRRELKKTDNYHEPPVTQYVVKGEEISEYKNAAVESLQSAEPILKDDILEATEMLITTKRNANSTNKNEENVKSPVKSTTSSPIQLDEQVLIANYHNINTTIKGNSSGTETVTPKSVEIVDNKTNLMDIEEIYEAKRIKNIEKLKDICPAFQNGQEINLGKMPGAWNIIYYQMPENLSCFKMQIRKTTLEEKKKLLDIYGDLSYSVDWEKCHLEILTESSSTRHYLQGEADGYGVLRNIILTKNETTGKTSIHEETPDQWRIFGNLLIMRDCESGEIAAFMKNTSLPTQSDVIKGLHEYGIEQVTGKVICYAFPDTSGNRPKQLYNNNNNAPKRPQDTFEMEEDTEFSNF